MNNARIYSGNSTVTSGSRGRPTTGGSMADTATFDQSLSRNKSSLTMTRDDKL